MFDPKSLVSSVTETIELGHQLVAGMPNHPSHPPYLFTPYLRYGDFELDDGYLGTNELMVMSGHSGTHIDSLAHVACRGSVFGGRPTSEVQGGPAEGLKEHGVDSVVPIIKRGVLLDVAAAQQVDSLAAGQDIGKEELQRVATESGADIAEDDCVIVRTGWGRNWGDPEAYLGEETGTPGITLEAATWLADKGTFLIGSDNSVVEVFPAGSHALPVHLHMLPERGVHLMENMALEDLHRSGVREFLFIALPLRLRGASGSPVRPVALV